MKPGEYKTAPTDMKTLVDATAVDLYEQKIPAEAWAELAVYALVLE